MSEGCLSQKCGPVLLDLCLAERSKEEHTIFFDITSLAGVCSWLVKGSQIVRELGFAQLVGVEHGVWKCCNVCQL